MKMLPVASVNGIDLLSKQKVFKGVWLSAGIVMFMHLIKRQAFNCIILQNIQVIYRQIIISGKKIILSLHKFHCQLMGQRIYLNPDGTTGYDRPYSNWRLTIFSGI